MIAEPLSLPDVVRLTLTRHEDTRGSFTETWSERALASVGIARAFVQDNESVSERGVLRGMHLQSPSEQGKLVRVVLGEVYDVAVDLRAGSPSFGRWVGVALSDARAEALWIPAGFAHGFLTLSPRSIVAYKVDAPYVPADERVLAWDDPDVAIAWPLADGERPLLSDRDARGEGVSRFR
ncbi:MAG: dTDP-4-dehydrorhamnose 3,5-epimerase [Pseudomonadota bacterium]|nr:dTDP-4-dehydrorhamnose 3,5-epimerase [Pseudomonadota bacterium]